MPRRRRSNLTPLVARLASQGLSDPEIGERLDVRPEVVGAIRRKNGIPPGFNQKTMPKVNTPAEQIAETVTIDGVTYCPPRFADGVGPRYSAVRRRT